MTTITLVQAAQHDANHIHLMTAQPGAINLVNLSGGAIQFTCNNAQATLANVTSVDITYDGAVGGGHESLQVSSVIA